LTRTTEHSLTTFYSTVSDPQEGTRTRHDALASAVSGIRVRRGGRIPVEQILLGAAAVLLPLGLIFILLGWEGAAHNGHTYAQIDYLISGGIFGLGLSVAGGFMYFGYWLSRQLGEARRQSALTVQALGRLEELLEASMNARVAGMDLAPVPEPSVISNRVMLFATPKGTLLHRAECPVVSKRTDLRAVGAGTENFGYCTMCDAAGAAIG
jgi:hypothetical protein